MLMLLLTKKLLALGGEISFLFGTEIFIMLWHYIYPFRSDWLKPYSGEAWKHFNSEWVCKFIKLI